ncbi:MAG: putative phage protein [Acidimicrobiales bacterium]|nr:putative phage protein [Acidimicrobiales bacterium]
MTEQNPEDYVLVHKSKAKISRARKMVIGVMAIGAVAALANSGTFASFSASTTNDATFKTGTLILSNGVNAGTACFSSKASNGGANDLDLDANDTSCDALFGANLVPGATPYTAIVTVRNEGTSAGDLKVYAPAACQNNPGTITTNETQKLTFAGVTAGQYKLTFIGQQTLDIEYDASAATVKAALEALNNIGVGDVVVTQDGSNLLITFVNALGSGDRAQLTVLAGATPYTGGTITPSTVEAGGDLLPSGSLVDVADNDAYGLCKNVQIQVAQVTSSAGTTPTGDCVIPSTVGACSAFTPLYDVQSFATALAHGGTFASGETRFFKVSIKLPVPANNPVSHAACTNGFIAGIGCANPWMNGIAAANLRWQVQSS